MKKIPSQHLLMFDTLKNKWVPHPIDISRGELISVGLRCACTICRKAYAQHKGLNFEEWFE